MDYPKLNPIPRERRTLDTFRGLNRNLRIGAGEWHHMENLTSDHYPVLSPRSPRQVYASPASPQAIAARDMLCYVDGTDLVLGTQRIEMGLSTAPEDCPKQLVNMGAYLLILPDMCYVNTADPTDFGPMAGEGQPIPRLDYAIECGNRLWGCRYGTDENGQTVNRIYASKLGDFRVWDSFQGVSTDSYYVNLGSDGPFTGAISHLGCPLFFKENCLHKIFGAIPSEFTVQDTPCRGVQPGCSRSLAIVGETLYYRSRGGVCAYDGSLPLEVSYALGDMPCTAAVGGAHGSKYYISMVTNEGPGLYVYDTVRSFWHREDGFHALGFASMGGKLYAIDGNSYEITLLDGAEVPDEGQVHWSAQTGELGLAAAERKYISRITLRLSVAPGAMVDVYAQYDRSETWEHLCHIRGTELTSFSVPVRPRRCDFLRLKLEGRGEMKLYSMTKTMEKGSEL